MPQYIAQNIRHYIHYYFIPLQYIAQRTLQSFRNLEVALQQAQQNSLDEATTLAIANSLNELEKDKGNMFESFRNLDGALEKACQDSLNTGDVPLFESFRNLDEAMAMAMQASLDDSNQPKKGGKRASISNSKFGGDDYHHLERLEEGDDAWSDSEGSMDAADMNRIVTSSFRRKQGSNRSSGADMNNTSGRVEYVAEAAPDLERLARRHANRRFEEAQRSANLVVPNVPEDSNGQDDGGSGEGRPRRASTRRRRSASERIEMGITPKVVDDEGTKGAAVRRASSMSATMDSSGQEEAADLHYAKGRRGSALLEAQVTDDHTPKDRRKKRISTNSKKIFASLTGRKK